MFRDKPPSCTVTHFFADHHSKMFWDLKTAGQEYSVDHVTVLDFAGTSTRKLKRICKSSQLERIDGDGQEDGLTIIMEAIIDSYSDKVWQRAFVTATQEARTITICLYDYDATSVKLFNMIAKDILRFYGLTTASSEEIVQAPSHLP